MMKRRDLLKEAKRIAKERGETFELTEGGRHSIIHIGKVQAPVPRHNEINEITAQNILKHISQHTDTTEDKK